jgi:hypothetical protein
LAQLVGEVTARLAEVREREAAGAAAQPVA